jgi:hypothetical protein
MTYSTVHKQAWIPDQVGDDKTMVLSQNNTGFPVKLGMTPASPVFFGSVLFSVGWIRLRIRHTSCVNIKWQVRRRTFPTRKNYTQCVRVCVIFPQIFFIKK